jgi:hypothetical protein
MAWSYTPRVKAQMARRERARVDPRYVGLPPTEFVRKWKQRYWQARQLWDQRALRQRI